MKLYEFDTNLDETVGDAGFQYELRVYGVLASVDVPGLDKGSKPSAGYSAHGSGDIEATYNNKPFNIEVKLDKQAQMGSGICQYNRAAGQITPSSKLAASSDPADLALIVAAVKSKQSALDAYLDELANVEPIAVHQAEAAKGLPLVASTTALETLKNSGALKAINHKVTLTSSHIAKMYNAKGVFYIQIGGAGLFYMGSNPLNLPVPPFQGEANIEIRLKRSGDTKGSTSKAFTTRAIKAGIDATETIQARAVQIICAARLVSSKLSSPYTLDDADSIQKLFASSASELTSKT